MEFSDNLTHNKDIGVYVEKDGIVRFRPVRIGFQHGWKTQIPEGLEPGEKVVVVGHSIIEDENQKESEEFLSKAFIIALFLIFLILITLFNSVIQPVIILTSVVLSLGGAFCLPYFR